MRTVIRVGTACPTDGRRAMLTSSLSSEQHVDTLIAYGKSSDMFGLRDFSLDVIVRTPGEHEKRLKEGSVFYEENV